MPISIDNFLDSLLTKYRARKLDPEAGIKPLDFGGYGINGSITRDGRIIAINTYHAEHGYITLTSAPPFDEDKRYDPDAVRAYRRSLAVQEGFGFAFRSSIVKREIYLIEDTIPYLVLTLENGVVARCLTFAPKYPKLSAFQLWDFSRNGAWAQYTGKLWLTRCMYTQLTEGGTLLMPDIRSYVAVDRGGGNAVSIRNNALDRMSYWSGAGSVTENSDGSVSFESSGTFYPEKYDRLINLVKIEMKYPTLGWHEQSYEDLLTSWKDKMKDFPLSNDHPLDLTIRRALVYGLNCCIPLAGEDDSICIITDHMLLPLSWNRDAYYVARALLAWRGNEVTTQKMVFGHLVWMFQTAERVEGTWGRSYLANGKVKDVGYQLDQQIFPLLELADYFNIVEDTDQLARFIPYIAPVIETLLARRHPSRWLFATEETPADDPIAQPYHLSSHILMWHTFNQLDALNLNIEVDFTLMAEGIRAEIDSAFITEHNGTRLYAYATDGDEGYHFYHDANDVPLILAPIWGICSVDDPVWRATVDFAFSPANKGGYYDFALGSVHTPAPWALGDAQEWLYAKLLDDDARQNTVIERLKHASQWDGALPEAYNKDTFAVESRHWFAWPNALLAWFILEYS